ncbi:hypothetical protein GCM10009798_26520 [Nocardioides panacihumi]|uniref:Uncharacterized protein n=1 Tax=Nocardioides panacihumi TaxID=400774 RepID=A0ABP5CJM1_9ACTN
MVSTPEFDGRCAFATKLLFRLVPGSAERAEAHWVRDQPQGGPTG